MGKPEPGAFVILSHLLTDHRQLNICLIRSLLQSLVKRPDQGQITPSTLTESLIILCLQGAPAVAVAPISPCRQYIPAFVKTDHQKAGDLRPVLLATILPHVTVHINQTQSLLLQQAIDQARNAKALRRPQRQFPPRPPAEAHFSLTLTTETPLPNARVPGRLQQRSQPQLPAEAHISPTPTARTPLCKAQAPVKALPWSSHQ